MSLPSEPADGRGRGLLGACALGAELANGAGVEAVQREAAPHGVFVLGDGRAGKARELTLLPTTDLLEVIAVFGRRRP